MSLLAGVRVPLPVPWERLWRGLHQERDLAWVRRVAASIGKRPEEGIRVVEEALARGDVVVVRGRDDRRIVRLSPTACLVAEAEPAATEEPEEEPEDAPEEDPEDAPEEDPEDEPEPEDEPDATDAEPQSPASETSGEDEPEEDPAPSPRTSAAARRVEDRLPVTAPGAADILVMMAASGPMSSAQVQRAWERQMATQVSLGSVAQRLRQMVRRGMVVRLSDGRYTSSDLPAASPSPDHAPAPKRASRERSIGEAPRTLPLAALILGMVYEAGGILGVEALVAKIGAHGVAPSPAYRELVALRRAGLLERTTHRQYKLPTPEVRSPLERAAARVAKAEASLAKARAELLALLGESGESPCQEGSASAH